MPGPSVETVQGPVKKTVPEAVIGIQTKSPTETKLHTVTGTQPEALVGGQLEAVVATQPKGLPSPEHEFFAAEMRK